MMAAPLPTNNLGGKNVARILVGMGFLFTIFLVAGAISKQDATIGTGAVVTGALTFLGALGLLAKRIHEGRARALPPPPAQAAAQASPP